MIAEQSVECGDPAPLLIREKSTLHDKIQALKKRLGGIVIILTIKEIATNRTFFKFNFKNARFY